MFHYLAPEGINLPNGFATTAKAYYYFLDHAGIRNEIASILKSINTNDVTDAEKKAARIRSLIIEAKLPDDFEAEIKEGYKELSKICGQENLVCCCSIKCNSRRFAECVVCWSTGIIPQYFRRGRCP